MTNSLPPTPPRSPSPRRTLDTDSIFGSDSSRAPSPTLSSTHYPPLHTEPRSQSQSQSQGQPQPHSQPTPQRPAPRSELSNLPALRRQHINAGYRAGLASGRDDPLTAQTGFDEGYPVGAALGMRAGFLAGIARVMRGLEDDAAAAASAAASGSAVGGGGAGERTGPAKSTGRGQSGLAEGLTLEALVSDMQARGVLGREMTVDDLDAVSGEGADVPDETGAVQGQGAARESETLWKPQPERWLDEVPALRDAGERVRAWSEAVGVAAQWSGDEEVLKQDGSGERSSHVA